MEGVETPEVVASPDGFAVKGPPGGVPLLVVDGATKFFGPVKALINGSATLYAGETHTLLGENGAGKSKLVKILASVYAADGGHVTLDGKLMRFSSPIDAREGVARIRAQIRRRSKDVA